MKILKSCVTLLVVSMLSITAHAQGSAGEDYKGYRLSHEEMQKIAGKNLLSHRIFYTPSKGPDAAWFDAVKKGDMALVKKMVEAGQDIEAKDEASLGQTALLWATFIGYKDMVEYLIEKKANLYATDRADVQHVFKSAVLGGHIDIITLLYPLMKDKINLNAQDERDGETALMVAAYNDRVDAVNFLIAQGADVSIISTQLDQNAFTYACKQKLPHMVEILKAAGGVNHKTGKPAC